jgi:hypothetical protein
MPINTIPGIDANSGPPSTLQMMRLAANAEFRQAAQKVVTELQNAGVDITSQVRKFFSEMFTLLPNSFCQDTMQELMGLTKKTGGD